MTASTTRAWQLFFLNRYDLAEKELGGLLAHDPDDALAHAMLGNCLARRGEYALAHEEIRAALQLQPDLEYAHYVAAKTFGKQHLFPQAEVAIREALRINPNNLDFLDHLSWLQHVQQQYRLALATAEQGLRIDPEHAGCRDCQAMALSRLDRHAEAEASMLQALAREPLNDRHHTNLGWIYLQWDNQEKALASFCEGVRLAPDCPDSVAAFNDGVRHRTWKTVARYLLAVMVHLFFVGACLTGLISIGQPDGGDSHLFYAVIVNPILTFAPTTFSTTFLLQFSRVGRTLLSEERRQACRWMNAGLLLLLLSGFVLPMVSPEAGTIIACLLSLSGSFTLVMYFECAPGRPKKVLLAAFVLWFIGVLAHFYSFPHGIAFDAAGDDRRSLLSIVSFAYIGMAFALRRWGWPQDQYASLRGLLIQEGLERRAKAPVIAD